MNYIAWKKWTEDVVDNPFAREAYDVEFAKSGITGKSLRILEIGFGNGGFLNWARDRGHQVVGIEVLSEMVERARARGHEVHHGHCADLRTQYTSYFDVVGIWDVLEHVERGEIGRLFESCAYIMKTGGKILLRVPNGRSPFSSYIQYADPTHVTILSDAIIEDIARASGFELRSVRNSHRSALSGNEPSWKKRLGFKVRDLIEIALSRIYYGRRYPLDPVMVVTLEKVVGPS